VKSLLPDLWPCQRTSYETDSEHLLLYSTAHVSVQPFFFCYLKNIKHDIHIIILSLKEERNNECLMLSPVSARTEAFSGATDVTTLFHFC